MKLVHKNIDKILNLTCPNLLIVENSKEFLYLVSQFFQQVNGGEGDWVLSENTQTLQLDKCCLFIYDYLNLNFSGKKIENLINNEALKLLKEGDFISQIFEIKSKMAEINNALLDEIDLPIFSKDEFSYDDFIKVSNYAINEEIDLPSKIITYIDIFIKLGKIKLVVLVDLFHYLTQQEVELLIKNIQYLDVSVLLIDSQDKYTNLKIEKTIIDDDLCLI